MEPRSARYCPFCRADANIDTVTEQLLEQILAKLPPSTTKVIIAHRLNTIANADEIFFINGGDITPAGSMHGPSIRRLDFNMSKLLRMGASRNVELRLEVYNVTNTTNFLPPGGNFGSADFGVISQTGNYIPRQMQFAMKYLF